MHGTNLSLSLHYLSTPPSLHFKGKCVDWFLKHKVLEYHGDFTHKLLCF